MRAKLLMVSVGAALVMTLGACGGSDDDPSADLPEITYDPGVVAPEEPDYGTDEPDYGTEEPDYGTEEPDYGTEDPLWEEPTGEPPMNDQELGQWGLSDKDLLDDGYDNFDRNMDNYNW